MNPTYKQIASDLSLWLNFTCSLGVDRKYEFEVRTVSERVRFLKATFGRQQS